MAPAVTVADRPITTNGFELMGFYRQIHTKIWKDGWFLDLSSDHKLLFIYLFSNERANLVGLYDLPIKVICFETGLDREVVEAGLAVFEQAGKAFYADGWVWVRSLLTYNAQNMASQKIQRHLELTLDDVPDIALKARMLGYYGDKIGYTVVTETADTVSIPICTEQEQETELEPEQEQEPEPDKQQNKPALIADVDPDSLPVLFDAISAWGMGQPETVAGESRLTVEEVRGVFDWLDSDPPDDMMSKYRLARWHIREGQRAPAARASPPDRRRFIGGEYAELIEH